MTTIGLSYSLVKISTKCAPALIFTQVLLADEINRASPKVQSALLEAMAEGKVSIEGNTHPLPDPFFV
ncbi:AAA family ATPase, partial [Escherichia coli]|nr:AAA family ATPase [Escherichia coli]